MKGPMITVNWRNKQNIRGLAELTEETLRKVGAKINKETLIGKANELHEEYEKAKIIKTSDRRMLNVFSFDKELSIVRKYANVVL